MARPNRRLHLHTQGVHESDERLGIFTARMADEHSAIPTCAHKPAKRFANAASAREGITGASFTAASAAARRTADRKMSWLRPADCAAAVGVQDGEIAALAEDFGRRDGSRHATLA